MSSKGKYGEPWGEGDGCCGAFIDYQAHDDERAGGSDAAISDYNGREPIWLGGTVDPLHRRRIVECVNALADIDNPAALPEFIEAAKNAASILRLLAFRQCDDLPSARIIGNMTKNEVLQYSDKLESAARKLGVVGEGKQ